MKRLILGIASLTVLIFAILLAVYYQDRKEAERVAAAKAQIEADYKAAIDRIMLNVEFGGRRVATPKTDAMVAAMGRISEERRREWQHQQLVTEMQEANRIARAAAFNAQWFPPQPPATPEPMVIRVPNTTDWFSEWQKQQALNGIRGELQQMRFNQEYQQIQQTFRPYY